MRVFGKETGGKLVLTGARSRADVYAAFDRIYPVLVKYDKSRKAADK